LCDGTAPLFFHLLYATDGWPFKNSLIKTALLEQGDETIDEKNPDRMCVPEKYSKSPKDSNILEALFSVLSPTFFSHTRGL
jgi:hypothetical protein